MTSYTYDVEKVIQAVIDHGQSQYYDIAQQLGMTPAKIESTIDRIPGNAGKLKVLIDKRRAAIDDETLIRELLDACDKIQDPIGGAVRRQLGVQANRPAAAAAAAVSAASTDI